jgi:hypothetical protein
MLDRMGSAFAKLLSRMGIVRREANVLAYIDAFWPIAWVSLLGILLVLQLRPPPPNPLIASRGAT